MLAEPYAVKERASTNTTFRGIKLSSRIIPAAAASHGGDWCEAFEISRDTVALSIGDICGHGRDTFEAMTAVRQAIRDASYRGLTPALTLAAANRFLLDHAPTVYATALFGLLDTSRQTLVFANAGHPAPLMLGPCGTRFLASKETDLPLGIRTDFLPAHHAVMTRPDTLFVIYTDGVTEHQHDAIRGELQLRDAARFAYYHATLSPAAAIQHQMFLTGANKDDAAILTAWTPSRQR